MFGYRAVIIATVVAVFSFSSQINFGMTKLKLQIEILLIIIMLTKFNCNKHVDHMQKVTNRSFSSAAWQPVKV